MNKYLVKITRYWEREVEAENEDEAKELSYDDIEDSNGDDFDDVEVEDLGEGVYKASIDIQKHINKQVEQCLIGFCETLKKKVKILPSLDYDYRSLRCVPDAKILFLDDVDETLKEVLGKKKD